MSWGNVLLGATASAVFAGYVGYNYGHSAGIEDAPEHFAYLEGRAAARDETDKIRAAQPTTAADICEEIIDLVTDYNNSMWADGEAARAEAYDAMRDDRY